MTLSTLDLELPPALEMQPTLPGTLPSVYLFDSRHHTVAIVYGADSADALDNARKLAAVNALLAACQIARALIGADVDAGSELGLAAARLESALALAKGA